MDDEVRNALEMAGLDFQHNTEVALARAGEHNRRKTDERVGVMVDNVSKFCDSVHEKLNALESRLVSLRLNTGTTWHSLQEKLDEVRRKGEATRLAVTEARANLEQWVSDKKAETKSEIDQWVERHETQKLDERAARAEKSAWNAILVAQASIDDAERMIMEAIAARREADGVTIR